MKLNIRYQFLAYTLGIVLAVAAGLAARMIGDAHRHEMEGFRQEAQVVTTMLAGSLANDIYFLDLASIQRKLRGSRVNPAIVSAYVFDPQGMAIASSGRESGSGDEIEPSVEVLPDLSRSDRPLIKEGQSLLDTMMPVRLPDDTVAGYVAVRFSLDGVFQHMKEATWSVVAAAAVAVLLAGLLALIVSWYFTRPILAIKDAALAVSGGALATRSNVKRTDEIGQLSASIDAMADSLVARLTELEIAQVDLRLAKDATEEANREISELNESLERRVTERTAELREAQEALVQKERLSALGQLTATVAHELRNPLSVIQNTLFTLRQSLTSKGITLERPMARIERSIGRCNRIISDLLDYSRQRELQYQEHPIDDWLTRVLAEQIPPANVAIKTDLQAGVATLRFDPERLRRVAINLIDNAAQAFAEQSDRTGEAVIVVGTRASADGVEIFVRDNGPGIPADVLPRIFEPLFSTKSFGTGLGLPTVKQIIEAHGGNMDISSVTGEGTCVRAWLPLAAERSAA
jgi:signal transduction histidine kinase